jgi:hypothetical protein
MNCSSASNALNLLRCYIKYSKVDISFSINCLLLALLRHYALLSRRRFGGVRWTTHLGGRLTYETRYVIYC